MIDDRAERAAAAVAAVAGAALIGGWPAILAAALSGLLTAAAMPLFRRYAMARPNARSSHSAPVPQGGGAAVAAAVLTALAGGAAAGPWPWLALSIVMLAVIGAVDDIRHLPVPPRLGGQVLAVGLAISAMLAAAGQVLPLPFALEFALLVGAGVWFVNLTNFMDGIDGITLAGFAPPAGAATLIAMQAGGLSAALGPAFLGALAGFLWFNWPRAKLFLGDVGSLPIGLIGGALILDLAQHGAFAAAVILPLYHFADATLTLLQRIARREKVWEAHRQHAYQNAVDGGWSHGRVSGAVFVLNLGLAGLALLSCGRSVSVQIALVALAAAAVAGVILLFRSRRPSP